MYCDLEQREECSCHVSPPSYYIEHAFSSSLEYNHDSGPSSLSCNALWTKIILYMLSLSTSWEGIMLHLLSLELLGKRLCFACYYSQVTGQELLNVIVHFLLSGLGYAMISISGMVCIYYNMIIAYTLFYFFASFTGTLPWSHCDNDFNTLNCSQLGSG